MIQRALQLKKAVDLYCLQSTAEKDGLSREDNLTADDWEVLSEIRDILRPFAKVNKAYERNGLTLFGVVGAMGFLVDSLQENLERLSPVTDVAPPPTPSRPQRNTKLPSHLQQFHVDLPTSQRTASLQAAFSQASTAIEEPTVETTMAQALRPSINAAIAKLQEYNVLLHDSLAYWITMILHPGHRVRWMDLCLSQQSRDSHVATFKRCFQSQYAHLDVPTVEDTPDPVILSKKRPAQKTDSFLTANRSDYYDDVTHRDEINAYLTMPRNQVGKPLEWWKDRIT